MFTIALEDVFKNMDGSQKGININARFLNPLGFGGSLLSVRLIMISTIPIQVCHSWELVRDIWRDVDVRRIIFSKFQQANDDEQVMLPEMTENEQKLPSNGDYGNTEEASADPRSDDEKTSKKYQEKTRNWQFRIGIHGDEYKRAFIRRHIKLKN